MGTYQIFGGKPLCGEISIHGAKNSVLPILAATLVSGGVYRLYNCPDISDVTCALEILRSLGCRTEQQGDTITVDTYPADSAYISAGLMKKMRAAILFLGALLARFGQARLSHPGGCVLGRRPIDLHLKGLRHLGAQCAEEDGELICWAEKLTGGTVALPFPSVGATENLILAALACEGETILCNAAREPEIGDLIGFLNTCGAEICGADTSVLRIRGGRPLHGGEYTVMPDRMETATYLAAAAATGGNVILHNTLPCHLTAVTEVLRRAGCRIGENETGMCLQAGPLRAVSPIRTAPYDGFPTDAQAPVMAALSKARGVSIFEEAIFSDRFRHVPALCAMGAKIRAVGAQAIVEGVETLHGAQVTATDLRGGAAMVIAALSAEGESRIDATEHMERGYEAFAENLRACGAQIIIQ